MTEENELNTIMNNSVEYFNTPGVIHQTHRDYIDDINHKAFLIRKNEEETQKQLERQNTIKMIMRQTDYNYEQAEESLDKNKTVEKCIEEYLGVVSTKIPEKISTNQAIYKSIREWMK